MAITFADHTFKRIFYNENYDISVLISVKFFPMYLTQFDSGRHIDTYTRVNIGSCNGRLMLDGTKPLPEAMLTHKKSPVKDVHLRAILQEIPQPPITKVYLKTTFVKYLWNIFQVTLKAWCVTGDTLLPELMLIKIKVVIITRPQFFFISVAQDWPDSCKTYKF